MSNIQIPKYYKLHKPFGYLSQFTQETSGQKTLADLFEGPKDVYPIGRLDKDSEGLLLLSNDKALVKNLLKPSAKFKHYYVQLDGSVHESAIDHLTQGVDIRIKKKNYRTLPAFVKKIDDIPELPGRIPPIRFRKDIPTSWLLIRLSEGKNRQIRRMCAAVGFPVLRIFRFKIGEIELGDLAQGKYSSLNSDEIKHLQSY